MIPPKTFAAAYRAADLSAAHVDVEYTLRFVVALDDEIDGYEALVAWPMGYGQPIAPVPHEVRIALDHEARLRIAAATRSRLFLDVARAEESVVTAARKYSSKHGVAPELSSALNALSDALAVLGEFEADRGEVDPGFTGKGAGV